MKVCLCDSQGGSRPVLVCIECVCVCACPECVPGLGCRRKRQVSPYPVLRLSVLWLGGAGLAVLRGGGVTGEGAELMVAVPLGVRGQTEDIVVTIEGDRNRDNIRHQEAHFTTFRSWTSSQRSNFSFFAR